VIIWSGSLMAGIGGSQAKRKVGKGTQKERPDGEQKSGVRGCSSQGAPAERENPKDL